MSKKSDKKELLNIITKPQKRYERIWLSTATLVLSLLGLFVAWWFWNAIVQGTERPQFDIIGYVAPIGLAISCLVGLIAALQIAKRQPAAVNTFQSAIIVGLICFIGITVNSIMAFIRYNEVNWFHSIGQAFADFNLIEIGPINLAITTIITVAIIVSIIVADTLKSRK